MTERTMTHDEQDEQGASVADARIRTIRDDISENRVPGGSAFARAGAELIALTIEDAGRPAAEDTRRTVDELARWLRATKPSMAVVHNLADQAERVAADAPDVSAADAVIDAMRAYIAASEAAMDRLASLATEVVTPGAKVLLHSFSASLVALVQEAIRVGIPFELLVTESRPYRESRRLVGEIAASAVPVTLFSDAGIAIAVQQADVAIVGADSVFTDGSFANKTGSLPLALACAQFDVPFYVATELSKLYRGDPDDVKMELRPAAELSAGWDLVDSGRVTVWNQFFERVDARFVAAYLTESGSVAPADIVAAADRAATSAVGAG
jgi:ribose 1,5-bisphosphate isomerase